MSASSPSNGLHNKEIRSLPLAYRVEESDASATRLILALLPEWGQADGKIEFTRFKDGITNTLMKAVKRRPGISEEQLDKEAVLLRAYGNGTEVLIDREQFRRDNLTLDTGTTWPGPPLLARFQNGLLYRFIRGQPCTSSDLTKEPVWRGVAQKIAQWHARLPIVADGRTAAIKDSVVLPLAQLPSTSPSQLDKINAISPRKPVPNVWTVMQKWIFALPHKTPTEIQRRDSLQRELERSVAELGSTKGLGGNGLVFAHCDLLSGNVIVVPRIPVNEEPIVESVSFIDYEYATPSPAAFDLANHFSEWGGFECDYNVLPTRSTRKAFLQEYIASYTSHTTLSPEIDYVSRLFGEVDKFRGIPGLYWGIWALIQATISQIDFDYASYAEVRLAEYWDWRAEQDGSREKKGAEQPLRERRWAQE